MKKIHAALLAIVCAALIAIIFKPASAVQRDTPGTLMNLETQFMNDAAKNGSSGYMSYYADSAVELPNGADAIVGKDNIAGTMGFLDQGNKLTWTPEFSDMSGDLGYTYGTWEFTSKDKGKDGNPIVEHGKYVTIWKKQSDGTWKVALDMGNSSKPKP